jgi:hypothetical protein
MKDQIHIRNHEAAELARALARQTDQTISGVVLDALRQYRPGGRRRVTAKRAGRWRRLLREDRARGMREPGVPVEDLYDEATGLPR